MFAEMQAAGNERVTRAVETPDEAAITAELAKLVGGCREIRDAALVGPGGELLGSTREGPWAEVSARIWGASGDRDARMVHVATGGGEVFALRDQGLSLLLRCDRFALASLIACDGRAALRSLAATVMSR